MFKINKKVEYALMALRHMHEKKAGELASVKEICERYGSPFDVTSRSMQKMTSGGLLKSEKGAHGGYSISTDLTEVNFLEFMEMVVEPVTLVNCVSSETSCALAGSCNVITPMINLNEKMRSFFSTISLQELVDSETAKEKVV